MSELITRDSNPFGSSLNRYLKHGGLEIRLVLRNGDIIVMNHRRYIDGDCVVQPGKAGEVRIPLADIRRADIYAM